MYLEKAAFAVCWLGLLAGVSADCNQTCAQAALTFAYQYGYPLAAYGRLINQLPINNVTHTRELATASSHAVVRPNADTLYSTVPYDLTNNDLIISFGKLDNWYWLFSFYDPYGDNYANFGSIGDFQPGKYRLRHANDSYGVQGPASNDTDVKGYINSPTPHGSLLVRTAVYNRDTDYPTVHAFQDTIHIETANRTFDMGYIPPLDASLFKDDKPALKDDSENATTVMSLTAALAPWNLPLVHSDRARVATMLSNAGIQNGTFTQPAGTNMTLAQHTSDISSLAIFVSNSSYLQDLGNKWQQTGQPVTGNFSSHYAARQYIAARGYLQLTQDQALYPSYYPVPHNATMHIGADEAAVFTFSSAPEVMKTGFWSLTAYGSDEYMIPNSLNRNVLNSGSNITHADGSLVRDGNGGAKPFQIIVQAADKSPGGNWTNNWLPGPAGGGYFVVNLRLYGAGPSMSNGTYQYPVVTIEKAKQASNSTNGSGSPKGSGATRTIATGSTLALTVALFTALLHSLF